MTPWRYHNNYNNGRWQGGGGGNWGGSQAQAPSFKWWTCQVPQCLAALKKQGLKPQVNHPKAMECTICELRWDFGKIHKEAAAEKAKVGAKAAVAAPLEAAKAEARKATAAAAEASGGVVTDSDMECEAEATIALTDEYISLARLLQPPQEMSDDWTAIDTLDRFLPKKCKGDPRRRHSRISKPC